MPFNNVAWVKPQPAEQPKTREIFIQERSVDIVDGVLPAVLPIDPIPGDPCITFELTLHPDAPTPVLFTVLITSAEGDSYTRKIPLTPGGSYSLKADTDQVGEMSILADLTIEKSRTEAYAPGVTGTYTYDVFGEVLV